MKSVAAFVRTVRANPVWAFAWTVFVTSAGVVADYAYDEPERVAYFQRMNTRVTTLHGEYTRGAALVRIHDDTFSELSDSATALNAELTVERLSPTAFAGTVGDAIVRMRGMRRRLSAALALVNNAYFEALALVELRNALLASLTTADSRLEMDISAFRQLLEGDSLAEERYRERLIDVTAERERLRSAGRRPMIEHQLDRARQEFNDTLREAQAQRRMFTMRAYPAAGCLAYSSAFLGFTAAILVRRRRRRGSSELRARLEEGE
jgi:hypothetical protein